MGDLAPLVLHGGNLLLESRPDGGVQLVILGSNDPLLSREDLQLVAEWLDDRILADILPGQDDEPA